MPLQSICFSVAELSQNAMFLSPFGFRFERKQNPRIEENAAKDVERDGSDGDGLSSPKAGALPGCATPRLCRFSIYSGFLLIDSSRASFFRRKPSQHFRPTVPEYRESISVRPRNSADSFVVRLNL